MPYPIITPSFYQEIAGEDAGGENAGYNVLVTPHAIEYAFPLSQEKVVRKLMSITDVLSFKMTKLRPEHEEEYSKKGAALIEEYPKLKNYWPFKVLTMNALQNRNYVFEKRMLLLNYAYKTLQAIMDKGDEETVGKFVGQFVNAENHDSIIKYFESVKPSFAYSLCDGLSLLRSLDENEEYGKLLDIVFENAGCDRSMKEFTYNAGKYMPVKKEYYEVFLKGREHYIEQVMVNYVWTYCMPYADATENLWDNFVFFNTLFNTVKVLLTCATYNAQDKDEMFVRAITEFDSALRRTQGNIVKRIVDANKSEGLANNGDMAILSMS